jgi:hypothetical protein
LNVRALLTKDQLSFIVNEVNLQMQGYGVLPKWEENETYDEFKEKANKYYYDYWYNKPGERVERKQD